MGIQLLWLFSVMATWLVDHLERVKDNMFIGATSDREIMRRLCDLIDYDLGEAAPASTPVTFNCEAGHPEFTIPAGSKSGTREIADQEAVIFETNSAQIVTVGTTSVDIASTHGETISVEIIGSSDGTTRQRFSLLYRPVIWQSESVEVLDGGWIAWARVDNFVDSAADDKHYRIEVDGDGYYIIIFGDGINGRIPVRGSDNVRVTYRKGGGTAGNVAAGMITELLSSVTYVESVTNAAAATGGTNEETLAHAAMFGPPTFKAGDRAVTAGDIETLCNGFVSATQGGVAQSKVIVIGGVSANVMIVPRSGGLPSPGLKTELLAYLESRQPVCTNISILDPQYRTVDLDVEIWVERGFATSDVIQSVRAQLLAYLSPVYQDPGTGLYPHEFGRDFYVSDIHAAINQARGVDHFTLKTPIGDVAIQDYQIGDVGTISLTLISETQTVTYEYTGVNV
jgi:predicted phage baseplate assembly protein